MCLEKRSHQRHTLELPIHLTESELGIEPVDMTALNISEGGLCAACDRPVIERKVVHLSFECLGDRIDLEGRVIYCRRMGGLDHQIGIQFIEPPPRIKSFVETIARDIRP